MKHLWIVLFLAVLHTLPLWNLGSNLAGAAGDPFAHAAIGEWYCKNVVTGNFHSDIYMSPYGMNMAGNYDSPFPFILTCPFTPAGPLFQFHLFTLLQIFLILFSAWLVAKTFLKTKGLQFCYLFFVWWCGFYVVRSHQHMNLLSLIWGLQFVLYAVWTVDPKNIKKSLISGALVGLAFAGTFYNIASLSFLVFVLMVYKLWKVKKDLSPKGLLNLLAGFAAFLGIFIPLWGPMIYFTAANGVPEVAYQRSSYNLDLLSPFIPYAENLLNKIFDFDQTIGFERYNPFEPIMLILTVISLFTKRFWKDGWRVAILVLAAFYFVLALGPELRINNDVVASLGFNADLLNILPFRLSRTPARFAALTNLSFIFLGFIYLDQLKKETLKKYISYGLLAWILITGPLLNQMWLFPTLQYQPLFPMKGLASLKQAPKETIVVSIPSAWAQDPTQNFHRLFHQKNITSAYLSYPAYSKTILTWTMQDPILGKMGCAGEPTAFSVTDLLSNPDKLQKQLRERHMQGFIINKQLMLGENCKPLRNWLVGFLKQPWVKVTEENAFFITAELL